jgi:ubiquinone/menaquinone biosynthesis C-methylase UbiE
MTQNKRSAFELINLPTQFGVTLLIVSLILFIGPYFEGSDFGVFKVPVFRDGTKSFLKYFGPVFFALTLLSFVRFWEPGKAKKKKEVGSNSKFRLQSISDIVKNEARCYGINIDGIHIGDRLSISDLERICTKTYYPEKLSDNTCNLLEQARAKAFTIKYAEPKEDEKLVNISQIKLEGIKEWTSYFYNLLKELRINSIKNMDVLDVGIGNGHAEYMLFDNLLSFKAVDISVEALAYAGKKLSNVKCFECSAENLYLIKTSTIDLYLSFRTFQSTLFDRRTAVHEAYRVLRKGGLAIISIPKLYLNQNGDTLEVLQGLIPPNSYEPEIEYANKIARRIKEYMEILNFIEVGMDDRSPFEIYVYGKR